MTNVYYNSNGDPVFLSPGVSAKIRAQFLAVQTGFDGVAAAIAALQAPTQPQPAINVNPDFVFDQVNEGNLYTVNGVDIPLMDGWVGRRAGAGEFKVRRLADPDNAALKCMEITCTTADASIAAADHYEIATPIEGYDIAWAGAGTAQAKQITTQFRFKTNITGTYGVALSNGAQDRRLIGTIAPTDTNEHDYSLTWTLDTTGTWNYTNGVGLRLHLTLAAGTTTQGTAGTWAAGAQRTTSAQVNFMSNTSNVAYLKRCHVVASSVTLPYAPTDYDAQLLKCQRYFRKTFPQGVAVAQNASNYADALFHVVSAAGGLATGVEWRFDPEMRDAGGIQLYYNPGAANSNFRNFTDGADSGAVSLTLNGQTGAVVVFNQVAGDSVGDLLFIHATKDARLT